MQATCRSQSFNADSGVGIILLNRETAELRKGGGGRRRLIRVFLKLELGQRLRTIRPSASPPAPAGFQSPIGNPKRAPFYGPIT